MERRVEDIIRGRTYTPTRRECAEREKRINEIIHKRWGKSFKFIIPNGNRT
jgi:hypothetical protein